MADDLRDLCSEFIADDSALGRLYALPGEARDSRFRSHLEGWLQRVQGLDFDNLQAPARVDAVLLRNLLERRLRQLDLDKGLRDQAAHLVPFDSLVQDLEAARRRLDPIDPEHAAATLDRISREIEGVMKQLGETVHASKPVAAQAADRVKALQTWLKGWFEFYNGYDPLFGWWASAPYSALDAALTGYAETVRQKLAGVAPGDTGAIIGSPIGREALLTELKFDLIPYTPEELIEIADKEFAWCEEQLLQASRDLGFGDETAKAREHVKGLHAAPGKQTEVVKDLALEAIRYVEERDLVTVPDLAKETWRMAMMSPEAQKTSPFFLGGETIIVSFPTHEMSHQEKRMSMRGNNTPFSRSTVQHELIPGHHLQFFMLQRHRPHRKLFGTPFWIEGWTMYWELHLWNLGFPRTPEERIGMLFWRMHRCARIIFSLRFHLGEMTPDECIDFLVDRVGHERANAEGEVRRSFAGAYPPLYQLAYMIGGIQVMALRKELVDEGGMPEKEFHDRFLQENQMPIEALREVLAGRKLPKDFQTSWRFAG